MFGYKLHDGRIKGIQNGLNLDRVDIGLSEIKNLGCKNLVKHTGL
jgi:hypothetical protein